MPMSSGGHVASSSGCATRPKVREIGLTGCAVPTQRSLLIGSYVMATAEHREPCDSRGSCTVLGAPGGEIPPGDSTKRKGSKRAHHVRFAPQSGHRPTRRACPLSAKRRHSHCSGIFLIRSPRRHTNIGPIVHQFCALSRASIIFFASAIIASLGLFSSVAGLSGSADDEPGGKIIALQPFPTGLTSRRYPL